MARKSLRPHLNQIRAWVRQGRTDAWIAHQLEVTVRDIEQFKRQNELVSDGETAEGAEAVDYLDDIDLRAADDALIAAELEAAELQAERERAEAEADEDRAGDADEDDGEGDGDSGAGTRTRRRGRRGGRRRGSRVAALEGTFDHGEEGYGLWLDPAIQDNPVYAEHWAGHRPVTVVVEEDRIVIRRTGTDD
jgi:membrane protein involved in colicin uptake